MRKLIAGMKISLDSKMEGPDGTADWVEAWSEDYDLDAANRRLRARRRHIYPGYDALLDLDTE